MAKPHVVTALAKKRAEITGKIAALEREIRSRQHELAHVDATLKLFDPSVKLSAIAPKRAGHERSPYFVAGEISDRCHDAIRETGEASAEQIAVKAMRDKGLDPDDRKLRSDFVKRVHWALERMHRSGALERIGKHANVRWRIAEGGAE